MNKLVINILFLFMISSTLFSQSILEKKYQDIIRPFWNAVQNNDRKTIIDLIHYPLKRQYPIPQINNNLEMNERYETLFDETLLNIIKNSSIETDWTNMGWRGIMLGNGKVWIDYDGKIIAVNYQSPQETELMKNIIIEIKNYLHKSLIDFVQPVLSCKTENYKFRIDLLDNNYNYRLSIWSKDKEQSDIPDMVLSNGERIPDGSGGNHLYVFNDKFQYILSIDILTACEYGGFSIYNDVNNSWIDNIEGYNPLVIEKIIEIEM